MTFLDKKYLASSVPSDAKILFEYAKQREKKKKGRGKGGKWGLEGGGGKRKFLAIY